MTMDGKARCLHTIVHHRSASLLTLKVLPLTHIFKVRRNLRVACTLAEITRRNEGELWWRASSAWQGWIFGADV